MWHNFCFMQKKVIRILYTTYEDPHHGILSDALSWHPWTSKFWIFFQVRKPLNTATGPQPKKTVYYRCEDQGYRWIKTWWHLCYYIIHTSIRKDSLCGINVSTGLSLFLRFHTVKVPLVWEHMNCLPSFNQYAEITGYCSEYRTKKDHWWIFF